jgi:hypothetical protein
VQAPTAPEEIARWNRWFAVDCNNRAWRLAEAEKRTAADDEEMLHLAHAAAFHWGAVGTEVHNARAAMLLGHVHALLGHGALAMKYARQAFAFVMARESPSWEIAFAHAVLANAAAASCDGGLHKEHYAAAQALGAALSDAEERAIFDATFRAVPAPA